MSKYDTVLLMTESLSIQWGFKPYQLQNQPFFLGPYKGTLGMHLGFASSNFILL